MATSVERMKDFCPRKTKNTPTNQRDIRWRMAKDGWNPTPTSSRIKCPAIIDYLKKKRC